MATTYSVRVYRNRIPPIFRAGGEGNRWMYRVSVAMMNEAILRAPVRSSVLKRSHSISPARRANQYAATFEITNNAEHAEWVHDGVPGRIYPKNGRWLSVPSRRGSLSRVLRPSVAGQAANPWLDDACTAVAIRYGATRVA